VLAGCAILEAIRRAFPCRRLRVADRGLREGILVQLMREDGMWNGRGRRDDDRQPRRAHQVRVKTGKGRPLSSKLWLERQLNDPYVARAKRRPAFAQRLTSSPRSTTRRDSSKSAVGCFDLGAAPGGWSQVAAKRVGATEGRGRVVAIDVLDMPPIPGVEFVRLDFPRSRGARAAPRRSAGPADVVLSDMAANATGTGDRPHQDRRAGRGGRPPLPAMCWRPAASSSPRCCKAAPSIGCSPNSSGILRASST